MAEEIKSTSKPEIKSQDAKTKKDRKIFSKIILVFIILLLTITLLISFTQSSSFKNWLRGYITEIINEEFVKKESSLKIGSIEGNFFSELILNEVVLTVQKDEMVKFDRIRIYYDIFRLKDKHVLLHEVLLQNSSVNFIKIKTPKGDSLLNIVYLFSSDDDKKEEGEFDWKIEVERLRIDNLNFTMLNSRPHDLPISSLKIPDTKSMDIDQLKISNFTLETKAYYDKNSTQLQISYLGFNSNFGFNLIGLSGGFYISKQRAEVTKMNIETSRSWLQMDYAFIHELDLMKIENGLDDFKGKDMKIHMLAKRFDFDDLKTFLPAVDFLDGQVALNLKANGKFDNFRIEQCLLRTVNSELNFRGKFMNLTQPEHLNLDVEAENISLDPRDALIHCPGLQIPDYTHIGKVNGSLSYKGEPLNFQTSFDIHTGLGDVKGNFDLNLTVPGFSYNTNADTKNLNIGKIFKNEDFLTDLTSHIEAKGSGFSLSNINTRVKFEISNSKIKDYNIDKSSGEIYVHNYNIDLNNVNYASGKFKTELEGTANIRDFRNPIYTLKGKTENLDVSQFTKRSDDKSNLTFAFDLKGHGYSLENINGTYNINFANSNYSTYNIPATPLNLIIVNQSEGNLVSASTKFFDFRMEGKYRLNDVADVLLANYANLENELNQKYKIDSTANDLFRGFVKTEMDFTYSFVTKDSSAFSRIMKIDGYSFDGTLNGVVKNSANGFNAKNFVNVKHFTVHDTEVSVRNLNAELFYNNNYTSYIESNEGNFEPINSTFKVQAKNIQYNSFRFDSIKAGVSFIDGNNFVNLTVKQDSVLYAGFDGKIDLVHDEVTLDLRKLNARFGDFSVSNSGNVVIKYHPYEPEQRISLENFHLSSNILNLNISGYYALKGESDLNIECKDVSIPRLIDYISDPRHSKLNKLTDTTILVNNKNQVNGKIRRLMVSFKGTIDEPVLGLEMNTGMIRYETTKIGRVDAFIDYKNRTLSPDILISSSLNKGSFRLSGEVPFNNPLASSDSISYNEIISQPSNLNLKAKDFQINFFSKLLPNFADVRGFLNADLEYSGTIDKASLSGDASIDKGRFLFTLTDMYYRFTTKLHAEGSKLVVDNFQIRNIEDKGRQMDIFGSILFSGLSISYLDFSSSGDLQVLERNSRNNTLGFYGDVVAGIGNPAVTLAGPPNNMIVKGQLIVKSANLVFPSIQGFSYNIYEDDFTYRLLRDTLGKDYYRDTIIVKTADELDSYDPFLKYKYVLSQKPTSILDFVTFDLEAVTEKNVVVNVNFNDLTREELFGELNGKVYIDNKGDKKYKFFGTVDIVGDSYYRYYKNFKVNNSTMRFNGDPVNPEVNINAVYQNVRTVVSTDGTVTEKKNIILEIRGTRLKPTLTLKIQDPETQAIETGSDAQANAISYLIFGQPIDGLGAYASRSGDLIKNLSTQVGTNILSSLVLSQIREVAPFILNTELIYNEGSFKEGADIRITSAFGDAIVKFGGRIFQSFDNAEFNVEYPLNKIVDVGLSNNLLLEFGRQIDYNSVENGGRSVRTGVKLTYKLNY